MNIYLVRFSFHCRTCVVTMTTDDEVLFLFHSPHLSLSVTSQSHCDQDFLMSAIPTNHQAV